MEPFEKQLEFEKKFRRKYPLLAMFIYFLMSIFSALGTLLVIALVVGMAFGLIFFNPLTRAIVVLFIGILVFFGVLRS